MTSMSGSEGLLEPHPNNNVAQHVYAEMLDQPKYYQYLNSRNHNHLLDEANDKRQKKISPALVISIMNSILLLLLFPAFVNLYWPTNTVFSKHSVSSNNSTAKIQFLEDRIIKLEHQLRDEKNKLVTTGSHDSPGEPQGRHQSIGSTPSRGISGAERANVSSGILDPSHQGMDWTQPPTTMPRVRRSSSAPIAPHIVPNPIKGVQFTNRLPSFTSSHEGTIHYWLANERTNSNHTLADTSDYSLIRSGSSVQIKKPGLFLVYAQIHFDGNVQGMYQYKILSSYEGKNSRVLAHCGTIITVKGYEESCYTSVLVSLGENEMVWIDLNEQGRRINLHMGHSFFGLIRFQ